MMQNNLRKLRKEKGLSQIAVQMQTGIEQALISKYENGERVPPTETLMQLADFTVSVWITLWAAPTARKLTADLPFGETGGTFYRKNENMFELYGSQMPQSVLK